MQFLYPRLTFNFFSGAIKPALAFAAAIALSSAAHAQTEPGGTDALVKINNSFSSALRLPDKGLSDTGSVNAVAYQAPVAKLLPVTLVDWTVQYNNGKVSLKWATAAEHNASHFIIERSFDGAEYSDIAMLFAQGNSEIRTEYAFKDDKVSAGNSGVIYYRLKMVDMNANADASFV